MWLERWRKRPKLSLDIEPSSIILRKGERLQIRALLRNRDSRSLTLVLPGDGSRMARRTPTIEWQFTPGGKVGGFEGCGVLNALRAEEVFTLLPDETRSISEWITPLKLPAVDHCRAVMVYINDPELPFVGTFLRPPDPAVLALLRTSDKCSVVSNEVEITIEN